MKSPRGKCRKAANATCRSIIACLLIGLAAMAVPSAMSRAQSTQPAPLPAFEKEPIHRTSSQQIPSSRSALDSNAAKAPAGLVDFRRVVLSLAVVLSLIFLSRWAGKRFFPGAMRARTNSAVRLLTRTPIAPKQHVLLVQVGRRVLVVADNGAQMNSLSEITDPDEVAQLIGQVVGPNASADPEQDQAFVSAFGKAQEDFETQQPMPDPQLAEVPPAEQQAGEESAHLEIKGLMEKVRGLARQLGRS